MRPSFSKVVIQILSWLLGTLSKCFQSCCQNLSYFSRRKFRLVSLQNLQLSLPVWANIYRSFGRKVSPLFSKQNSTCSEEQLEKKASFTLLSFFLFWVTSSCSLGKSTSAGLSKLNSTFPGETFRNFFWKTSNFAYFSDSKRKKFSSLTEKDRHRCQNYLHFLEKTNSGKFFFCWKFCCDFFSPGFGVKIFALLAGKFGRFIKTVYLRVRCILWRFYFQNSYFFENDLNWAETLWIFGS